MVTRGWGWGGEVLGTDCLMGTMVLLWGDESFVSCVFYYQKKFPWIYRPDLWTIRQWVQCSYLSLCLRWFLTATWVVKHNSEQPAVNVPAAWVSERAWHGGKKAWPLEFSRPASESQLAIYYTYCAVWDTYLPPSLVFSSINPMRNDKSTYLA